MDAVINHKKKDETIFPTEISAGTFMWKNRRMFVLIIRDITERKEAHKTLKRQRHLLSRAQEIGRIGTWELDIAKNELLWTDENYRIFGVRKR